MHKILATYTHVWFDMWFTVFVVISDYGLQLF